MNTEDRELEATTESDSAVNEQLPLSLSEMAVDLERIAGQLKRYLDEQQDEEAIQNFYYALDGIESCLDYLESLSGMAGVIELTPDRTPERIGDVMARIRGMVEDADDHEACANGHQWCQPKIASGGIGPGFWPTTMKIDLSKNVGPDMELMSATDYEEQKQKIEAARYRWLMRDAGHIVVYNRFGDHYLFLNGTREEMERKIDAELAKEEDEQK